MLKKVGGVKPVWESLLSILKSTPELLLILLNKLPFFHSKISSLLELLKKKIFLNVKIIGMSEECSKALQSGININAAFMNFAVALLLKLVILEIFQY